jgi:hypothetical protein
LTLETGVNGNIKQVMRYYKLTMPEWKPISLSELYDQIQKTETDLNGDLWNFWQLIKIDHSGFDLRFY